MTTSFQQWGTPHGIAGHAEYNGKDLKEWEAILDRIPFYKEYTIGPQGSRFEIFKEKHHSDLDIKMAKRWLKNNLDVVSIDVINETKKQGLSMV